MFIPVSVRPLRALVLIGCGLVLALMSGCGGSHRTSPVVVPGYGPLVEDLRAADTAALRGRLILLDPGHGGFFRGARGPNGLSEAEVNLGVALHLRGLLEWAGARVVMTRTSDTDFLAGTDSTLAADLAFRVSMMDSLQPDVFVSIHHNSNPSYDPVINETQTYYPLGDEGPSRQLARAIHRHLALNLQIRPARILPGNFHVLRNATVPAVLGEPAMLSNPVMAGRLSLAASQRREAEAYFLGLAEYFALGAPGWSETPGDTVLVSPDAPGPLLTWVFTPDRDLPPGSGSGLPGVDPASFDLRLNGRAVDFALDPDGRTVHWSPPGRISGGVVTLQAHNLAGHDTPVARTLLLPVRPAPPRIHVLEEAVAEGHALITWDFPAGSPVSGGRLVSGDFDRMVPSLADTGLLVLRTALPPDRRSLLWQHGPDTPVPCFVTVDTLAGGSILARLAGLPPGFHPRLRYRGSAGTTAVSLLPGGFVVLPSGPGRLEIQGLHTITLPPAVADSLPVLSGKALLPGLPGRTIVIDPRGGGTAEDGVGPLGTRGADLNLEVARLCADILRGAGARVHVTRRAGRTPSDPEKVLLARRSQADLFLVISRATHRDSVQVRHYPGSTRGMAWAAATARFLTRARVAPGPCLPVAGADYLLRHTHCAALVAALPPVSTTAAEWQEEDADSQRCEALALALGVMELFGHPESGLAVTTRQDILAALDGAGMMPSGRAALWDGQFTLPLPKAGPGSPAASSLNSYLMLLPAVGPYHSLAIPSVAGSQLWGFRRAPAGWTVERTLSSP